MNLRVALVVGLLLIGCKEKPPAPSPGPVDTGAPKATTVSPTPPARVSAEPSATAAPKAQPKLNVLLLTIDSMRAQMPWTGYERDIAPNLTALAKGCVNYTHAYAVSSGTPKSVPALLTGRYPSAVYRSGYFFATFSKANLFFTEALQERGIRTLGGHSHAYFDRGKQLDQGFDVWEITPGIDFDNETDKHVTSDKMTKMAIEMLDDKNNSDGQFFMWLHYMDPHDQYLQHADSPTFGKKARDRYDSEIFFADKHVGKLLDYLRAQPYWDNTAVIVSADHGEAFGEQDMYRHGFELWEVITRVPLLVCAPGAKARAVDLRRSHIDLAPTILDLMGAGDVPKTFQGRSMKDEIFGAEPDVREPIVLDLPEDHDTLDRQAIIKDDYKLIVKNKGTKRLLFNLAKDPNELKDVASTEPDKLAELVALYDKTMAGIEIIAPYGGVKMRGGSTANGPMGPDE